MYLFTHPSALKSLEFEHINEEGEAIIDKLESYEIAALSNLNPSEADQARSLIPRLDTSSSRCLFLLSFFHVYTLC